MKNLTFKSPRGFTMLEIVFVIVMIGILAAVIIPRMQDNRLRQAADQVISHIRYTQHLAMMDDKFSLEDNFWFRTRWQIHFFNQATPNDGTQYQGYVVFSNMGGQHEGSFSSWDEVAINPMDRSRHLVGGTTTLGANDDDSKVTRTMNLGKTYDIVNVVFAGGCDAAKTLTFDYIGRPMVGDPANWESPYPEKSLLVANCVITLTDGSDEEIDITIQPETGFASITRQPEI